MAARSEYGAIGRTDLRPVTECAAVAERRKLVSAIQRAAVSGLHHGRTHKSGEWGRPLAQIRLPPAYPVAPFARLRALKDRYDPTNLFHLNQNIPPS